MQSSIFIVYAMYAWVGLLHGFFVGTSMYAWARRIFNPLHFFFKALLLLSIFILLEIYWLPAARYLGVSIAVSNSNVLQHWQLPAGGNILASLHWGVVPALSCILQCMWALFIYQSLRKKYECQ